MRVLIIGGYGNFGLRLAKLLSGDNRLTLVLAGRNIDKARAACRELETQKAKFEPLKLDRSQDLTAQITSAPDLIVDASGPFQAYGKDPYRVADYAISKGAHYLDLADAARFVAGVSRLDAKAKAAGIMVLSGLSTYPCLTSTVIAAHAERFDKIEHVRAGIAPSPRADLGLSVMKAITSYAGKPIPALKDGQITQSFGLTAGFKYRIHPPGGEPLDMRLFSNVDAPETRLMKDHLPDIKSIWLGAGPRPTLLHRGLMALSLLVKHRLLPGLGAMAPLFHRALGLTRFGPHRSGMFVEMIGPFQGQSRTVTWHLTAEGDDGPNIPVIPAYVIIKKLLAGEPFPPGARAAIGVVSLKDYDAVLARYKTRSAVRDMHTSSPYLYAQTMGDKFKQLPVSVRALHRIDKQSVFEGRATVTRGKSPLSGLAGLIFRFPKTSDDVPVRVVLSETDGTEIWERYFDGRRMVSRQYIGRGQWTGLIIERFGPFTIAMAPVVKGRRMYLTTQGWAFAGIPLPGFLKPGGEIYESEEDGRFRFHVDICAPLIGRLVKYEGWLMPKASRRKTKSQRHKLTS